MAKSQNERYRLLLLRDQNLTLYYNFARDRSLEASNARGPTLSFTRATEGRFFDAAGVMQTAASGVARFDHNPATGASLGLLIEGARTNLALHSGDTSNAVWVASNITKETTSVTDPTGAANTSVRLTASSANGTLLQTVTSTIDDYSYAVFMKRVTGIGNIQLTVDNGVTWTTKTLTAAWTRFDVSDASETNPVFGVRIVTDTDAIDFWGSDLNKNTTFPTSHIPTVASSVTRNADLVSTTDVSWLNANAGTFYINVSTPFVTATTEELFEISDNSTSDRIRIRKNSAFDVRFTSEAASIGQFDLTTFPTTPFFVAGATVRSAGAYQVNDAEHFVNGTRVGTGDQTVTVPTGITDLNVGSSFTEGSFFNGHIAEFRYYNEAFDRQFLEDLSLGNVNAQ